MGACSLSFKCFSFATRDVCSCLQWESEQPCYDPRQGAREVNPKSKRLLCLTSSSNCASRGGRRLKAMNPDILPGMQISVLIKANTTSPSEPLKIVKSVHKMPNEKNKALVQQTSLTQQLEQKFPKPGACSTPQDKAKHRPPGKQANAS